MVLVLFPIRVFNVYAPIIYRLYLLVCDVKFRGSIMYFFRKSPNEPTLKIDLKSEKINANEIVKLLGVNFIKGDEFTAMHADLHSKLELKDKHAMLDYYDVVMPKLEAAKTITESSNAMKGIGLVLARLIIEAQEIETKASVMPEKNGTVRPGRGGDGGGGGVA